MRLILKKFFCWSILLFILSQPLRSQYFYVPDKDTDATNLTQQGDIQLSLIYPFKKRYNFQLAYSPFSNISIGAAYFHHERDRAITAQYDVSTKGYSMAGTIGVYESLNVLEQHRFLFTNRLESVRLYAKIGYNRGHIENLMENIYPNTLDFQSIFFRAGITLNYEFISLSFSTRFLSLDYKNIEVIGNFNNLGPFLNRLSLDVQEADPRQLKESIFRLSFKRDAFEVFGDYTTIRNKNRGNFANALFEKEYYSLGVLLKINSWF